MASKPRLTLGSSVPAVKEWERVLQLARLIDIGDGSYGKDDVAATRQWQELHGLDPSGVVDEATWEAVG